MREEGSLRVEGSAMFARLIAMGRWKGTLYALQGTDWGSFFASEK